MKLGHHVGNSIFAYCREKSSKHYFEYVTKVVLVKCILSLFNLRASNGEILNYMKAHNITGRFRLLESLYMNKLMNIVSDFPEKKQTAGNIRNK